MMRKVVGECMELVDVCDLASSLWGTLPSLTPHPPAKKKKVVTGFEFGVKTVMRNLR